MNSKNPNKTAMPTLESIANLIRSDQAKKIVIMAGAGISTAAGIPDFRTPGTGLYDNLQKYHLPYPEAIFDIDYFKNHPEPFFELAKELYPGNFLPTLAHYFILLLHKHNILLRCFTQNIDTLERISGLPDDVLVEAHGSFALAQCYKCKKPVDADWMRKTVLSGVIPKCQHCEIGIVKPCITFFGEQLPSKFYNHISDFEKCDLLIILGTSLQVQPFASLIDSVNEKTPRLLINREEVGVYNMAGYGFDFEGKYGKCKRDVFFAGTCDEGVRKLAQLCKWESELDQLYSESHKTLSKLYNIKSFAAVASSTIPAEAEQPADIVEQLAEMLKEKAVINETVIQQEAVTEPKEIAKPKSQPSDTEEKSGVVDKIDIKEEEEQKATANQKNSPSKDVISTIIAVADAASKESSL